MNAATQDRNLLLVGWVNFAKVDRGKRGAVLTLSSRSESLSITVPNWDFFCSEKEAATTHHRAVARHQLGVRAAGTRDFGFAAVKRTGDRGAEGQSDVRVASSSGTRASRGDVRCTVRKRNIARIGLPLFSDPSHINMNYFSLITYHPLFNATGIPKST